MDNFRDGRDYEELRVSLVAGGEYHVHEFQQRQG